MRQPITVTRKQLYDAVWSGPLSEVCSKFGISDVGLRKRCERAAIPRPPKGYWNSEKMQSSLVKPPLKGEADKVLIFTPDDRGYSYSPAEMSPTLRDKLVALESLEILFPQDLHRAHPVVRKTKSLLKEGRITHDGIRAPKGTSHRFWIQVSQSVVTRALLFMEGVVRALRSLRLRVDDRGVEIDGVMVQFCVIEKRTPKIKPRPDGEGNTRRDSPSGVLKLRVISGRHRWEWTEIAGELIENRAKMLIRRMFEIAARVIAEAARRVVQQAEALKRSEAAEISRRRDAEINVLRNRLAALEERYRAASVAWEAPGRPVRFSSYLEAANPNVTPSHIAYLSKMKQHVIHAEPIKASFLSEESAEFEILCRAFARLGVDF